jgi:hypothetical protein
VEKFREYLLNTPGLLDRARTELKSKRLGCWCKPHKLCHGDVIAELLDGPSLPAPEQLELAAPEPQSSVKSPAPAEQFIEGNLMFAELHNICKDRPVLLAITPLGPDRISVKLQPTTGVGMPLIVEGAPVHVDRNFASEADEYFTLLNRYSSNLGTIATLLQNGPMANVNELVPQTDVDIDPSANESIAPVVEAPVRAPAAVQAEAATEQPARKKRRTRAEIQADLERGQAAKAAAAAAPQEISAPAPAPVAEAPAAAKEPTPINAPVRGRQPAAPAPAPAAPAASNAQPKADEDPFSGDGDDSTDNDGEAVTGSDGPDDDFPF